MVPEDGGAAAHQFAHGDEQQVVQNKIDVMRFNEQAAGIKNRTQANAADVVLFVRIQTAFVCWWHSRSAFFCHPDFISGLAVPIFNMIH